MISTNRVNESSQLKIKWKPRIIELCIRKLLKLLRELIQVFYVQVITQHFAIILFLFLIKAYSCIDYGRGWLGGIAYFVTLK